MADKVIAFSEIFYLTVTLTEELPSIYRRNIPIHPLTDSKAMLDIISKSTKTSEKRLMSHVVAEREGFRDKVISYIGFVRISNNLADGLTNPMHQIALL